METADADYKLGVTEPVADDKEADKLSDTEPTDDTKPVADDDDEDDNKEEDDKLSGTKPVVKTRKRSPAKKEKLLIYCLLLIIVILSTSLIGVYYIRFEACKRKLVLGDDVLSIKQPSITAQETSQEPKGPPCEYDWLWFKGKCYYFANDRKTWRDSKVFCQQHNGSLVTIKTKFVLNFLSRYRGKDNHWIGLSRTKDNKGWIWITGEPYYEDVFTVRRSSSDNIEYVYLNALWTGSDGGNFAFKWICEAEAYW